MELREIDGFPGYKVSDDGRVWTEKRQRWLKNHTVRDGYLQVGMCNNGKLYMRYVHRLVAEAFIPHHGKDQEVNHKDEDKTNNAVSNLEWCDRRYNVHYGTRDKRATDKIKCIEQERYGKTVIQLTLDGIEVGRFNSSQEAARQTGFCQGGISNVCRGERHRYKGYIWKYKEDQQQ